MKPLHRVSALAMLAACGAGAGPPSSSEIETVVDTVAGVVRVRNSGSPPAWTAEPVLRLGSFGGGPEEFGRIRSLVADAEGNIYVAENLANEIRVFAPDGRYLRTIGRQGAGPGEFGDLYSLAWLDGHLAAMDPRNARIGILSPEGQWVDGVRHLPLTGPPSRRLLGAAPAPARHAEIPPYVRAGHLYQVETDEFDVEYVAVYQIGPQP